jgi:sec-independent protein translocase protein TatA
MNTSVLLFLGNFGTSEIVLIVFVFLLFFGAKSIPSLARGLGKGIREFKDAASGIQEEIRNNTADIKKDLDSATGGIRQEMAEITDTTSAIKRDTDIK